MYKAKDIVTQDKIPEKECEICYLCETAQEVFKDKLKTLEETDSDLICPCCGNVIGEYDWSPNIILGANYYNPDHYVYPTRIYYCKNCHKYFMSELQEIIYNANHDIYYTGADAYLASREDEEYIEDLLVKSIHENVKEYTERIKNKDPFLDSANFELWLKYATTQVVAKFLYKKGWKK